MSDMTIPQIRAAKAKAEKQIGDILLALSEEIDLQVQEVHLRMTVTRHLQDAHGRAVSIDATIVLEGP